VACRSPSTPVPTLFPYTTLFRSALAAPRARWMVQVRVEIRLKKGVTDPEGDNVHKALGLLGFKGVQGVRSSKLFLIDLQTKDAQIGRAHVEEMCRRLLANPVIHEYAIAIEK